MQIQDFLILIHPAIAVTVVFPALGMVIYLAWQTRQRRLETKAGKASKIAPSVGSAHLKIGQFLAGAVVMLTLIGLAYPISAHILSKQVWMRTPLQVSFIALIFLDTIGCAILLYRSQKKVWRAVFATLTGTGIVIIGCQDGVFRRTNEWYWSHYYIGIALALLMVFSLSIQLDIDRDKLNRWRILHLILNSFAVLLFIWQGITGTRYLLEIPLSWQKPYIDSCDTVNQTCPTPISPLPQQ